MQKKIYHKLPTADCAECGKNFVKYVYYKKDGRIGSYRHAQKFCSRKCKNYAQCPEPKGRIDKNGYRIFKSKRINNGVEIPEHRFVMENMLGRKLLSHETVHHKNGVRTDNSPENLELWSSRHGRGQRVSDKVEFALEILRLYAPESLNVSAGCEIINISDFINSTLAAVG